jgi:hypothetical protein
VNSGLSSYIERRAIMSLVIGADVTGMNVKQIMEELDD